MILPLLVISQQINHTWGYTTAGAEWNQSGSQNLDSISTVSIVLDLQDYYALDFNPVASDDSVIILNSTRMNYGTFWYRFDVENATDSTAYTINAYPGNLVYHPNDNSRITTTNVNFSTTATNLVTVSSYATDDIQWTAANVYLSDAEGKILPPEFIKLIIDFTGTTNDSIDVYWDFVYPAVYEYQQEQRTSGHIPRKAQETLHYWHIAIRQRICRESSAVLKIIRRVKL